MNRNTLLATDVYKLGHMEQYPEGTTKIYSYLCARSSKKYTESVFFGLQYYLMQYLAQPITDKHADEFLYYRKAILGSNPPGVVEKVRALAKLGYWPVRIKAIPEGSIVPIGNALMTITNTHPDFAWVVGFLESLLLKVWNTTTVATASLNYKRLFQKYADITSDIPELVPFQVHDFGYRGCSSEETAALSGAAHLTSFLGTDTVLAVKLLDEYYAGEHPIGLSVPATEHSVMCAFGKDGELEAFRRMLKQNPTGIVSIVSDTYNLWNVLENFTDELREEILARDGKVVFRPDSGDPKKIICGDMQAPMDSPGFIGALGILARKFGAPKNSKGFKQLNPKVGLIYGDGMYFERIEGILETMKEMGYASTNLVVGVGGILLQQHNRDDQGFAIKATFANVNGEERELFKDPITDSGKRSHKGLMQVLRDGAGKLFTKDKCATDEGGHLELVFENGEIISSTNLQEIRARIAGREVVNA